MDDQQQRDVVAAVAGDRNAFGRLYDLHIRDIYDFVYYKTHHRETAQDLTSQTFMKALRSISSFDANQASFKTWLYTIARRTVIDHYRKTKPTLDIEDAFDLADDTDIERDVHLSQLMDQVQPLLAQLTAQQREIVLLRLWQGKSYEEIADIVGKSESACKMLFSRTMRVLQKSATALTALMALMFIPRL